MTKQIALGFLLLGILAAPCAEVRAKASESTCAYEKADKELNLTYKKILADKEYARQPAFIAALKNAQAAWLKFRDAALEARYPGKDKQIEYGSEVEGCSCIFLAELTRKRTEELKVWVQGIEEGDVCSGSVKNK